MDNKKHLPLYGIGPVLCFPTAAATAAAIALSAYGRIPGRVTNPAAAAVMTVVGILLIIEGIALFFGADVGGKLSDEIKANRLKTNGSYRFVRNPCYVLFLLGDTGAILIAHNVLLLCLPVVFWLVMTAVLKRTEEKWLLSLYGQAYTEYCSRVNRLIPWFPKR